MMIAQDKERYDTLIDTIDVCLRILHEYFGTSFILTTCTAEDDDNALVHSGYDCSFKEALVMFEDLAEEDSNLAKAMGMVAVLTDRKIN